MQVYVDVLKKYIQFEGRSPRKEFWMFLLIHCIILLAMNAVDQLVIRKPSSAFEWVYAIYFVATLFPTISVTVRRLHDTGLSGWWIWLAFLPLVGIPILLYMAILPTVPIENKYGPVPVPI